MKIIYRVIVFFILIFTIVFSWADSSSLFNYSPQLSPGQAFQLNVSFQDKDQLLLHWQIQPGFMLYQQRIHVKTASDSQAKMSDVVILPDDSLKKTFVDGKPVFEHAANAIVSIKPASRGVLKLLISYQGCKGHQYCYPPQNKLATIHLQNKSIVLSDAEVKQAQIIQTKTTQVNQLFSHASFFWVVLSFFGFGILLSFTPCILPILPIIWSLIVGRDHHLRHTLYLASAYVLSMAVTFAVIGVAAAFAGHTLQAALHNVWVIVGFCIILMVLSLSLFDVYEFRMPKFLTKEVNQVNEHQKPGTLTGAIVMGCLSTLVVSPCVSAPLIGALLYIANTGNVLLGGTSLFFMALGMGIPLLVLCVAGQKALPKTGAWMVTVKHLLGVVMIGLAIWLLAPFIPGPIALILYAILVITTALTLGVIKITHHRWPMIKRVIAILLLLYGVLLIVGAFQGHDNPFSPLSSSERNALHYNVVTNMDELDVALNKAQEENKPVMIDFYAQWCVACREMDKAVFSHKEVTAALKPFVTLRVDLTKNTADEKAIAKRYHVFAPPSVVFYNAHGKLLKDIQVFGETDRASMLKYIQMAAPG